MNHWLDSLLVVAALAGAIAYFAIGAWLRRRRGQACGCDACSRFTPPAPGRLPPHIARRGVAPK
jgi:hypothetical protein